MHETAKIDSLSLSEASKWKIKFSICLILVVIAISFIYLQINPINAIAAFPEFVNFFIHNFWAPNFGNIGRYIPYIIESILFAVVGTYISAILAFLFGLMLSEKMNDIVWLRFGIRFIVSFLRNVPVLIWASLLVYILGIGSLVGLFALVIATLGFLARSYAESINEIADSKLEALKACGGSYLQILFHGLIPEFVPSWINWTLFSFEINIRASVILGMVGAGGVGIMIQTNIRLFKYHEALSLILILVVIVIITEFITNKIRSLIH